jgi:hypothetical protein
LYPNQLLRKKAGKAGGVEAEMQFHFLAGSSFPAWILFLNFCAQYIGGIVMIATPDDTRTFGYFTLMWISGCSWCGGSMNVFLPRCREIMSARNYVSPNDYLSDRYNNQLITGLGVLCSTFQMLMLTALEWAALKTVMLAVVGQDKGETANIWVWFFGTFIFACECMGGMASVALTDAIQACLLLFSFIAMPLLCQHHWGGFEGINGMECTNKMVANTLGAQAGGIDSPFGPFGTDSCYKNTVDDGGDGSYAAMCGINVDPERPDIIFPLSMIRFAAGVETVPPWLNKNYLFSADGNATNPYGEMEVCCAALTADYSACEEGANVCPPPGTNYVTADWVGFGGGFFMNGTHNVAQLDTTTGIYSAVSTNTGANLTAYSGMLEFPDGSSGYTYLTMSKTQSGCIGNQMHNNWQVSGYRYCAVTTSTTATYCQPLPHAVRCTHTTLCTTTGSTNTLRRNWSTSCFPSGFRGFLSRSVPSPFTV